jgi:peptidoglycan/LPS O-acetylase OafA/YrhL
MSVGLVYIVWTVIYFPVAAAKRSSDFPYFRVPMSSIFSGAGVHNLLFNLATGYYHLYFLLVLLEFYVVFPLVLAFVRRFPRSHIAVVLGALLWQLLFPYAVRHAWFGFVFSSKLETRLIFSYALYLLGGVIAALYLERFHDWVVRHQRAILIWTVVAGAVPIVLDYLYRHGRHIPKLLTPGADPFAAAVLPYDVGAIVAVYLLGVYLVNPKRSARTRAIVASGSEAAYGIYVSQLLWIFALHRVATRFGWLTHVPWLAMMLFAVTFTYLMGWLFSAIFARTPFARGLVCRTPVPWNTLIPARHQFDATAHHDFGEGPLNLTDE